jgi:hypothetical protein
MSLLDVYRVVYETLEASCLGAYRACAPSPPARLSECAAGAYPWLALVCRSGSRTQGLKYARPAWQPDSGKLLRVRLAPDSRSAADRALEVCSSPVARPRLTVPQSGTKAGARRPRGLRARRAAGVPRETKADDWALGSKARPRPQERRKTHSPNELVVSRGHCTRIWTILGAQLPQIRDSGRLLGDV